MPSTTTIVRMGTKGAAAMVRRPQLRRATVRAGKPPAKLGWRVGKVVVRRKARAQIGRIGATGRTVAATGRTVALFGVIYGSMVAEVFGLVEAPKPRRRAPVFAVGVLVGAGAVYVLDRSNRGSARGSERAGDGR
jgi:hypothetical protein